MALVGISVQRERTASVKTASFVFIVVMNYSHESDSLAALCAEKGCLTYFAAGDHDAIRKLLKGFAR
jgi:hypothetical protein